MIALKEGTRRTLEVRVTDKEAEALTDVGIVCKKRYTGDKPWIAKLCAEERDALRLARGVFGDKPAIDYSRSTKIGAHAARAFHVTDPRLSTSDRVKALLKTKEWRGSKVIDHRDDNAQPCVVLVHSTGARLRLWGR